MQEKHIGIVDLSSNIFRNYEGAKKGILKDRDNSSTSGTHYRDMPIFAVRNTLLQLNKESRVVSRERGSITHTLMVLDSNDKCFRHELYPEYKANRPLHELDFLIQKAIVENTLIKLGYGFVKISGYEADDVISTVATKCEKHGIKTTVLCRDKDLMALLTDNVHMYSGMEDKFYKPSDVIESKGVSPDRLSDMLVLMGDTADNIIGVKGFGAKSSSSVLSSYTLDELIESPGLILGCEVRGAQRLFNEFSGSLDTVLKMREIAKMRTDVDLKQNLSMWRTPINRGVNYDKIIREIVDSMIESGEMLQIKEQYDEALLQHNTSTLVQ